MEKILMQIVHEIGTLKTTVTSRLENLEVSLSGHGKLLNEYGRRMDGHGRRLKNLELSVSGMREEHGLMLRAILESKDVQRGEIDNLQHQSALLTGTLKRAANQIAEDLQEAK